MGVKHSGTLVANIGPDGPPLKMIIVKTSGGPRSVDGGHQTIQSLASTDEDCRTGDIIKYVNVHLQASPKGDNDNRNGWIEYAIVCKREADADIPSTKIGTQTIGDIATAMYRNECIWTGFFPMGKQQANGAELHLKIPKNKSFLHLGDEIVIFTQFRSGDSAATGSLSHRLVRSFNFKAYS